MRKKADSSPGKNKFEIEVNYTLNTSTDPEIKTIRLYFEEEFISYEQLKSTFINWISQEKDSNSNNFSINFIRYYDKELDGNIDLEEKNFLKIEKGSKVLIGLYQFTDQERELYNKIEKMNPTLRKSIERNVDICVLTANPLYNEENKKFLRTLNDYNEITHTIKNEIEQDKNIIVEFYPLTENHLKKAIDNKPIILHLICKSTYINNQINLLFEDDNYFTMKAFGSDGMKKYFDDKTKIEDIFLIISTPFSREVYEVIKDFEFKNILVQHTTVVNLNYMKIFNKNFYNEIYQKINEYEESINVDILFKNIFKYNHKNLFQSAKVIDLSNFYFFCCCCHMHGDKCKLKANLNNEIYINQNEGEISDNTLENTHISHTINRCCWKFPKIGIKKEEIPQFDGHNNFCEIKKPKYCCCRKSTNKIGKDNIFPQKLENNIEIICRKSKVKEGNKIKYDKMNYLVQKNHIAYEIYNFIFKNSPVNLINIYYQYSINELDELANALLEYFEERRILINEREQIPKKIKSVANLIIEEQENLIWKENISDKFRLIYKIDNEGIKNFGDSVIFFVNLNNMSIKDLLVKISIFKNKFILFTNEKIEEESIKNLDCYVICNENNIQKGDTRKLIKNISLNKLSTLNKDIKTQLSKILEVCKGKKYF